MPSYQQWRVGGHTCLHSQAAFNFSRLVRTAPQDLFSPFGPISRIYIAYDRDTGEARGFAFVNFVYSQDAQRAIEKLDGCAPAPCPGRSAGQKGCAFCMGRDASSPMRTCVAHAGCTHHCVCSPLFGLEDEEGLGVQLAHVCMACKR